MDAAILRRIEQFSNRPNVIRQTRFHRGCDSEARMNAAEIVVCEVRMAMRRFTRLTNAFSKKLSHLKAAVALLREV